MQTHNIVSQQQRDPACGDTAEEFLHSFDSVSSCDEMLFNLKVHYESMKRTILFLNRSFCSLEVPDNNVKKLLLKVQAEMDSITFEELEFAQTLLVNNVGGEDNMRECLKVEKLKGGITTQLLNCYKSVVIVLQAILTQHLAQSSNTAFAEADLKKELIDLERNNISLQSTVNDLKRRLSILQGKVVTLESYRTTFEDTKTELQNQFSRKESEVKFLKTELNNCYQQSNAENERLAEVMEEMNKRTSSDKSTLKKALKYQKIRMEEFEMSIQHLKEDLVKKEKALFEVTLERDNLRVYVTSANNTIIKLKAKSEKNKYKNVELQNEAVSKESGMKKHLKNMSDSLEEKIILYNKSERENLELKEKIKILEQRLQTFERNLQDCQSASEDQNMVSQQVPFGKGNNNLAHEMNGLVFLLREVKQQLETPPSPDCKDAHLKEKSQNAVLEHVMEIKEHLLELRNKTIQVSKSAMETTWKTDLEKQLKKLQYLYDVSVKENEDLKAEIIDMKSSKISQTHQYQTEISSFGKGDEISSKNIQMELRLRVEENWRLQQSKKELEKQLDEVKEKLQKKEIETFKMFSLEEELRASKKELSILEQKKEEESDRCLRRIKELQESLDLLTIEHDSLKRFVHILKSSLHNVFDDS